jgi:hypothetical protein
MQAWIEEEFATLDLGDPRRDARFCRILEHRMNHPHLSTPASTEASATAGHKAEVEATYRFFDNDAVDEEDLLEPHFTKTRERIADERVVIVAQDTTEIELTQPHFLVAGAGPLGSSDEKRVGIFDHALLAMTPERVPLGLLPGTTWARDPNDPRHELSRAERAKLRRETPFEERESFRWVQGYRVCCEAAAAAPDTEIISVSDSESDIYELLAETQRSDAGPRAHWIIRACQNRGLSSDADQPETARLFEAAQQLPKFGACEVEIRARDAQSGDGRKRKVARSQREADCEVRAGTLTIKRPADSAATMPCVTVNVVYLRERNPPEGEPPIEWLLPTDLLVDTLQAVLLVLKYYTCRWEIEVYFKVLKSGCRIEASQLETIDRFRRFLVVTKVVAWRLLRITKLGREQPDLPCTVVLDDDEWQAAYAFVKRQAPPPVPPTLGEMIKIVGRLGGWMGRKSDGPPGPKSMWTGLQRMRDLAAGWQAHHQFPQGTPPRKRRRPTCVE